MLSFESILCLFAAFIGFKTEKRLFNPVTLFCGLWGIIVFLSSLCLYNLYLSENKTYNLIFWGIVCFVVGYYFYKLIVGNKRVIIGDRQKRLSNREYVLNYKLIYFLFILCILFLLKDFISIFNNLGMITNLHDTQKLLQSDKEVFVRSGIENAFRIFIINPMVTICPIIAIVDLWLGKKDKLLIALAFVIIMMKVVATGGRAAFIQLFFYFIVMYTLCNNGKYNFRKYISKKNRKIFIFAGIVIVSLLATMTLSRAGQAALKTIYYDFSMQPMMFQIWSEKAEQLPASNGMATFSGLFHLIDYTLRNTVKIALPQSYTDIYNMIALTDTEWQRIGKGVFANAYVSVFWFFYVDGRSFGIMFGSFLYGAVCRAFYKNIMLGLNVKSLAVYSFLLMGVFYTFGTSMFSQSGYVLGLIFLYSFIYKRVHH